MDAAETELQKTVKNIEKTDERRASQVEYRDRQIVALLAKGKSWVRLQEITGLSPRGIQLAVKRANETTPSRD
jgi:hypothetical protein